MSQKDNTKTIKKILPIMTLREVVIFPNAIMPLFVGRESSIKAIEQAISSYGKYIFLVTQKEADIEKPEPKDLYPIGVVSRVLQLMRLPDGSIKVLFEGLYRATWETFNKESIGKNVTEIIHSLENKISDPSLNKNDVDLDSNEKKPTQKPLKITIPSANNLNPYGSKPYPCLITNQLHEIEEEPKESEALYRAIHEAMEEFSKVNRKVSQEHLASINSINQSGKLADAIMPHLKLPFAKKQEVLELLNTSTRLDAVFDLLNGELAVSSLEKKIKGRVKDQMERNQKEYYLSEQIKAIHKEMGQDDPHVESDELEARIKEKDMPDEARERALRELKKLRPMSPASAEYTVVRNYIDWLLDLPWNCLKEINININNSEKILNDAHFGLKKPKERILEYLAVQKLTNGLKGPILCLVGPPGVGKTSMAKSVAEATGREFVRISLGGVRDEAEIRGHRRTYVGAMPGKILMALKKAKFNNPLFCLDEIDKMTSDFRGDPSSALLEVLDPEQNHSFNDHYLDLDYDLSKIFFITTANSVSSIPAPLRDRMEIIELNSYLETEKMSIAKDFLMPKQLKAHGIDENNLSISDEALLEIIRSYTRESGVRNLEREIASLCRKSAIKLVETINEQEQKEVSKEAVDQELLSNPEVPVKKTKSKSKSAKQKENNSFLGIVPDNLNTYLGVKKYRFGERDDHAQIGVVTGLAFNNVGGDILYVETALMPGTGKIAITGQLGDVMKESAEAAFSYIRSRANILGLKENFYKELDIHVHVPEGATPKDGPSAGITIVTSIASALLGVPVLDTVAMTGEITLRGRVLPIGGLREKLLAARRSNIKTVILPLDNKKDLEDVPSEILEDLEILFVKDVDNVLPIAFGLDIKEIFINGANADFLKSLKSLPESSIAKQ